MPSEIVVVPQIDEACLTHDMCHLGNVSRSVDIRQPFVTLKAASAEVKGCAAEGLGPDA